MKSGLVGYCGVLLAVFAVHSAGADVLLKNTIVPRSQSRNMARDRAGWHVIDRQYKSDDKVYWSAQGTIEYGQSWNENKVARSLFGSDTLIFAGSRAYNTTDIVRNGNAVFADYFGLPANFLSEVTFRPRISTALLDISAQAKFGIKECSGFFVRANAPLVYSSWDLQFNEKVIFGGDGFHPGGYMAATRVYRQLLAEDVKQAWSCPRAFGDMQEPLKYGKLGFRDSKIGVAELRAEFGYAIKDTDCEYLSLALQAAAPTGSRVRADYLFDPIIGNGHHWELGASVCAHYVLKKDALNERRDTLYFDMNVAHLFAASREVSFDLKNNCAGSRYMLLAVMDKPVNNLFVGGTGEFVPGPAANLQYKRSLVPAINYTTLCAKTKFNWQVDAAFSYARECGDYTTVVGYNLWARDKERVASRDRFCATNLAIKGDAQMYGFDGGVAVPLAFSESYATVLGGQGVGNFRSDDFFENQNVDNPFDAANATGFLEQVTAADATALQLTQGQATVKLSNPAVALTDADINECSGLTARSMSHKLFAHVTYRQQIWSYCEGFYGFGGEFEWAGGWNCKNDAIGGWGLWFKAGVTY